MRLLLTKEPAIDNRNVPWNFPCCIPIWFTIHNTSVEGISWPSRLQLVQCTHPTCLGPVEQSLTGGNSRYEWHVVLSELHRVLHHSHPHWGKMHLTSVAQYLTVLIVESTALHSSHLSSWSWLHCCLNSVCVWLFNAYTPQCSFRCEFSLAWTRKKGNHSKGLSNKLYYVLTFEHKTVLERLSSVG